MRGDFDSPGVSRDTFGCLRHVLLEVINIICDYLFPLQLSRLSCVNEALYGIVIEQRAWNKFIERCYGHDKKLQ